MLRLALFLVLAIFVARAFWRLIDGVIEGVTGQPPRGRTPQRAVSMVRDPVCGTFVLPDRAVTLGEGESRLFFCSNRCRDEYKTRPSTGSGSHRARSSGDPAEGRTA